MTTILGIKRAFHLALYRRKAKAAARKGVEDWVVGPPPPIGPDGMLYGSDLEIDLNTGRCRKIGSQMPCERPAYLDYIAARVA